MGADYYYTVTRIYQWTDKKGEHHFKRNVLHNGRGYYDDEDYIIDPEDRPADHDDFCEMYFERKSDMQRVVHYKNGEQKSYMQFDTFISSVPEDCRNSINVWDEWTACRRD